MRPYAELLSKMKAHFTNEQDAEMVAMILAAEYQTQALVKICSSKFTQQLPAIASEAITTADEIAEKILKNIGVENDQAISSEQSN